MSDSPNPSWGSRPATGSAPSGARQAPWQVRLERFVKRARLTLWWERAWPALWLPLAVLIVFLVVSWLGLWLELSVESRRIGLGVFALAGAASLWPLARLRWPARGSALHRLEGDSGLKHGPAQALEDSLALGDEDPGSRALWDLHRRRAQSAIERLRLTAPRPDMARRDRRAMRAAGSSRRRRAPSSPARSSARGCGSAFDWRAPAAAGRASASTAGSTRPSTPACRR
jgi:hypothetical protein